MKIIVLSFILLWGFCEAESGQGEVQVKLNLSWGGKELIFDSPSYRQSNEQGQIRFSVNRLDFLISDIAFEKSDGSFLNLAKERDNIVFFQGGKKTQYSFKEIPLGQYKGVRFFIGPAAQLNHSDPSVYAPDHPLNPQVNQMHWDWKSGYIFMALEGLYGGNTVEHSGYVIHLANDENRIEVYLPYELSLKRSSLLEMECDISSWFEGAICFEGQNPSMHSREGDALLSSLKTQIQNSFHIESLGRANWIEKAPSDYELLYVPKQAKGFAFQSSRSLPIPQLPHDNPLTVSRVKLGEVLFNDPRLSKDGSISCASCHFQKHAFTDPRVQSQGVGGIEGERNSMPLFNLAWKKHFFWDGRKTSLRDQVLEPISSHQEMANDLKEVVEVLSSDGQYRALFEEAFDPPHVTEQKLALALECYLLSLSSYRSRFDQALKGEIELTDLEKRGFELFMTEHEPRTGQYGADCFHCHGGALFTDHRFHNNGITIKESDYGREQVTGLLKDRGRFSTPSLRNIALTAPYMHDGRFATLDEVLNHYNSGIEKSPTLAPNLAKQAHGGLGLKEEDLIALKAFLLTLTDPQYLEGSRDDSLGD